MQEEKEKVEAQYTALKKKDAELEASNKSLTDKNKSLTSSLKFSQASESDLRKQVPAKI